MMVPGQHDRYVTFTKTRVLDLLARRTLLAGVVSPLTVCYKFPLIVIEGDNPDVRTITGTQ